MATKKEKDQRRRSLRPHPARDEIVDAMRSYGQPISPSQLARITGRSLGSTAYHVRTLVSAGLAELADEGRVRGAVEHFYALVPGDPEQVRLSDPVIQLLSLCGALNLPDPEGGFPQPTVLDSSAREQLHFVIDEICPRVRRIAAEATRRQAPTDDR
jgi:DNA-binding transcriptional ArsR family regulator